MATSPLTTSGVNRSSSSEPKVSTSHGDALQAFPKRCEPASNRIVDSAGAPEAKGKSKMNMMVSTAAMTAVRLDAGPDLSNSVRLTDLIANLMATRDAAEASCTKLGDAEEATGFARKQPPKVRGGITEPVTITNGSNTTLIPGAEWFYSSREEIEKQGIEAAAKAATDSERQAADTVTAQLLADWDKQEKACKRGVPKALRTAQREHERAMTTWTKAEQAIVCYRPVSVEEAVELLTLAGRDPTRSKGQPRLDIDEADFRIIVRNCSTVLQGAPPQSRKSGFENQIAKETENLAAAFTGLEGDVCDLTRMARLTQLQLHEAIGELRCEDGKCVEVPDTENTDLAIFAASLLTNKVKELEEKWYRLFNDAVSAGRHAG